MRRSAWIGLLAAVLVAAILAPFASDLPDGLESVAERLGFSDHARTSKGPASPLAGIAGTLLVFVVTFLGGRLLRRKKRPSRPRS